MNVLDLIKEGVALFKNKKFDEAIEKLNQALDEIKDKDSQIQEQNYIQFYLGCCYFEQALSRNCCWWCLTACSNNCSDSLPWAFIACSK